MFGLSVVGPYNTLVRWIKLLRRSGVKSRMSTSGEADLVPNLVETVRVRRTSRRIRDGCASEKVKANDSGRCKTS
jgi:hypothetical protein